uniref:Uncharacterized protein n=1 Tax=Glossina pallidipes TaxID=7398 RepID=A0A1B0AF62_GLOPL
MTNKKVISGWVGMLYSHHRSLYHTNPNFILPYNAAGRYRIQLILTTGITLEAIYIWFLYCIPRFTAIPNRNGCRRIQNQYSTRTKCHSSHTVCNQQRFTLELSDCLASSWANSAGAFLQIAKIVIETAGNETRTTNNNENYANNSFSKVVKRLIRFDL